MGFKYSIIIPVYNRPQEVDELLESLTLQTFQDFEVLIVEDGSTITCREAYEKYTSRLNVRYFFKPNSGPGPSRNFGFQQAKGDYFVVFDSDCILPPEYFENVEAFFLKTPLDAWGGPDKGHEHFTTLQQAMAFTMSSVFTTGGIRGGQKRNDSFQPRSFNMGISKEVFLATEGFKLDRYAEDIEFSIRMRKSGFRVGYISDAFVYHKRRTSLRQFFNQVVNFGKGRVLVGKVHAGSIKMVHWLPSFFVLGFFFAIIVLLVNPKIGMVLALLFLLYWLMIVIEAFRTTKSIGVMLLAGPAAFVQLTGYGVGFLREILRLESHK